MVIVDDDVALPHLPQARGVAGTLFVHKIAGAMAEAGADLDTIASAAQGVIKGAISIGMSLDTCTVPGSPKEDRIASGRAELGLGIHGEAGVEQVDFSGARAAMAMVVDRLTPSMGKGDHVALLNNLGSTTPLEMSVLAEELARSPLGARIKWLIGPAPLMTSLDMHGFSLSLLPVDQDRAALLTAPVVPHAWPGCLAFAAPDVRPLHDGLAPIQPVPSAHPAHRTLIDALAPALAALPQGIAAAATAARTGADATAQMTRAKAGRASYLSEDKLKGHNDPGAEGVARLFETLARS